MADEKNLFEAGIAKVQIEAARQRLARNENLGDLHEESISYLNESLIALNIIIFVVSLLLLLLYSNTNILVISLLLVSTGSLIALVIKTIRNKKRMQDARKNDLSKYEK